MCLIVFDWRPDALDGPLFTLAANRDEFFRRTAEPIGWWRDAPEVLGAATSWAAARGSACRATAASPR